MSAAFGPYGVELVPDLPIVSDDPHIQQHYIKCRLEGTSHMLAEMFAFEQAPRGKGDKTWLAQVDPSGEQFGKNQEDGDFYAAEALARGDNISGAVYMSGLARYPGDPEAWVHNLGEYRQRVEDRGWGCEGAVNVKMRNDVEPAPSIGIAPDIVDEEVAARCEANPELVPTPELWHDVRNEIKPGWVKD